MQIGLPVITSAKLKFKKPLRKKEAKIEPEGYKTVKQEDKIDLFPLDNVTNLETEKLCDEKVNMIIEDQLFLQSYF